MMTRLASFLALIALCMPSAAAAQADLQLGVVDRVVAMVGDSAILESQVTFEAQQMQLADSTTPAPGHPQYEAFLDDVLMSWVDRLLVIQAAARDTLIQVDEASLDQQITELIDQLAVQFGGQPALQAALRDIGMTLAEYREMRRTEARQQQIVQLYMASQLRTARPIELTDEELLERFQELQPQMQQRPRQMTFRQVVIRPQAADTAKAAARAEIDSLLVRAQAGEDFAALATENSDDLGTAALGGDVGWFRRGQMVSEFENAAFALGAGRMGIAESVFGFHLIKVERTRGRGEVQARHILKVPAVSPSDITQARDIARRVVERALAGENMTDLFDEFGDASEPDSLTIAYQQLQELPPSFAALR
ncbi:MAG: peptidylprolyl isomerase, partial [Gemmatimonadota bacterium]|nr:peptidylprolyl isomerase [Gemmatimonadota bacterium]